MKTTIVKLEAPELTMIEESKAEAIRATFEPMVEMLKTFEDAFNEIVRDADEKIDEEITSRAKRLRIDIGKVRIETEKIRKEQKEEYLRAGKAIDGVSNILKWAVSDKEDQLKEIENYFEIQEQKRLEKLQTDRVMDLSKYVEDAEERDLASMDEDVWNAYFNQKKKDYEDRIEAERKAEEERKERERLDGIEYERQLEVAPFTQFIDDIPNLRIMGNKKYQELLDSLKKAKTDYEKEQERIRREREEIEKKLEEERVKAEEERKKREAEEQRSREAYEARLKKEREEKEKVEAELRAKRKAEEEELKRMEEEKRRHPFAAPAGSR